MLPSIRSVLPGFSVPAALLDTLGVGTIHFDPVYSGSDASQVVDLFYAQLNPVAQRLLGLPEFPATTMRTLVPHETAAFTFYRNTLQSGEVGHYDLSYPYPDQRGPGWRMVAQRQGEQLVVVLTQVPPAPLPAPAVPVPATWESVQERRTFYQVFAQTPAAICFLREPKHRLIYFNEAFLQLFAGRERQSELQGELLAAALPEMLDQGYVALLDRVYATGETYYGVEKPLTLTPTGGEPTRTRYFNFTVQAYQENGHTLGLSIFSYDVTEQVLARQHREAQRAEWQYFFEQVPVAIAVLRGPQYLIEQANPAVCALWDRRPNDVLGWPLFEVLPEAAGQGLEEILSGVMATGVPCVAHELPTLLDRGGQLVAVHWDFVCQPLYEAFDRIVGVIMVATDVSQQVSARQQVQELYEELQAINEELRANNEELAYAQYELHQLNQQLEARVAAGVQQAQQAWAQSERERERLERFFYQVPAAVCVLGGPEMVFELVNPSYQKLFPERPLLGLPLLQAMPEFANQPVWHQMQKVYITGDSQEERSARISLAQYSGGPLTDFYFHYVQQARYDALGRIDGLLVFALDITAQVRVQQRAEVLQEEVLAVMQRRGQEREAFYQIFAQTPAIIAFMRGAEYRFEYVNQAFEGLFPGRLMQGRPLAEAMPEAGPQGFVALIDHVYQTGEPYVGTESPLTTEVPGQPASIRYFNFNYQAYRENGEIAGVSVFAYDVSEQVYARQQREIGMAQLQTVFEHAPVALALLQGPTFIVEMANPTICAFWGRTLAQVLGQPLFEVLPEVVDQGFPEIMANVWRTAQPYVADEAAVQIMRYGRPETMFFTFVYQPLIDTQGQVTAVVVVATDVSARVTNR